MKNPSSQQDIIYGIRTVLEAINSGRSINKLLIQKGLQGDLIKELWRELKRDNIPHQGVPIQKLDYITKKNHQGVIAYVSPIEYYKIENLLPNIYEKGEVPLFLILDKITDVRNFGAIARTAECNNVHGIIIPSKGSAMVTSDAIKTSAGALSKLPVCSEHNLKNVISYLQNSGVKVLGCTEKGAEIVYKTKLTEPLAIIMGSEKDGISPAYLKLCDALVKIPMYGSIESLNVSVSASILMYEVNRQRNE